MRLCCQVEELRKKMQARAIAVRAIEKLKLPEMSTADDEALLELEPNSDGTDYHKVRAEEMEKTKGAVRTYVPHYVVSLK